MIAQRFTIAVLGLCLLTYNSANAGVVKKRADKAVEDAKRIEEKVATNINSASQHLAGLVREKELEVGEVTAVLNSSLKDVLKDGIVKLEELQKKLEQEEEALKVAKADARKEVDKISASRDELESKLSVAHWIQTGLGSGFIFAFIGIAFQYYQHKKSEKMQTLQIKELEHKVASLASVET